MRWLRGALLVLALSAVLHFPLLPALAAAPGDQWVWPLAPLPTVIDTFHPPPEPWAPGHRGVDLLGVVGQPVAAIGPGTVTFAGMIAGRGVVVVDHGSLRSTYEPVAPRVKRSESVAAGQVIATLAAVQSHCPPQACLHLGVRRGDDYIDPLTLLSPRPVRLKPLSGAVAGSSNRIAPYAVPGVRPPLARSVTRSESAFEDSPLSTPAVAGTVAAAAAVAAVQRWRRRRGPARPG